MKNRIINSCLIVCLFVINSTSGCQNQKEINRDSSLRKGLAGYWKLTGDLKDYSGNKAHAITHGEISFETDYSEKESKISAVFNGKNTFIEIPSKSKQQFENGDFSISAWVYTDTILNDVPGDIISRYDSDTRRGFHLGIKSNFGPTNTGNYNQLYFGIDDNISTGWKNYGKPGNALYAMAMAEYKGELYAGTCETGKDEAGHVYRFSEDGWMDCGSPDSSNSVTSLIVFEDELYAATGHYRTGGSALPESENTRHGGGIFRFVSSGEWENCGKLPMECMGPMIVFDGKLYASSLYKPAAFYVYQGGQEWIKCDDPGYRVNAMAVFNGYIYATSYDLGHIFRYDGNVWEDCGQAGDKEINTQGYCFAIYKGNLYVATWRSGRVYRFDGINKWTDTGRLGNELEVMGMLVHNGRLLAGTLPLAEVYVYEGDTTWMRLEQLDKTPDVQYRRAWTMAEHDGKAFCSTLPSGNIYGFEAGKSVMSPDPVPPGWQHVVAVKKSDRLQLYINGNLVSRRDFSDATEFNLLSDSSIKIGFGSNKHFNGKIREFRIYKRVLSTVEIKKLASGE